MVVVASARGHQTDHLIADALEVNPNPPKREMDMLLSTGEQQTVSLLAMALEGMGQKAISFTGAQIQMMTDNSYTKARIQSIGVDRIFNKLNEGYIVIVAGFQGVDEQGNITTLGRGGSDTSAVALAAALKAQMCEIYTDVDGVYTSDPRKYPKAVKMDQISYDEILELASLGAGVMHSRSIEFGKKYNVTIHVRSSMNDSKGTIITHEVPQMEGILVSGATIQKDLAKIGLVDVDNKPGNAAKVFAQLAESKIVVNDIIQTEVSADKANLSFTCAKSDLGDAKKVIEKIAVAGQLRVGLRSRRHRRSVGGGRGNAVALRRGDQAVQGAGRREGQHRLDHDQRNPDQLHRGPQGRGQGADRGLRRLRTGQARGSTEVISHLTRMVLSTRHRQGVGLFF